MPSVLTETRHHKTTQRRMDKKVHIHYGLDNNVPTQEHKNIFTKHLCRYRQMNKLLHTFIVICCFMDVEVKMKSGKSPLLSVHSFTKDKPHWAYEAVMYSHVACLLTLTVLNFWKFTSYCSLKPLWSGMGYLSDPTSPHPLPLCINCRD